MCAVYCGLLLVGHTISIPHVVHHCWLCCAAAADNLFRAATHAVRQSRSIGDTMQQQGRCTHQAETSSLFIDSCSGQNQASDCETATVVCSTQASTSGLSFDQVCHSATQLSCKSTAEVQAALQLHVAQFCEQSGYGMLLLLFSLLLTHGIR